MTRITPEALHRLLPAVHRIRDAEQGGPLEALIAVLAREGAALEENIEQLLDDLFIETCADWAAPYIGGVVGYQALHQVEGLPSPRAEVANTIGYRRRKGTAAVLEQLAHDVTGWPARVVEFFQLVATCQHMNHVRLNHHWAPDIGDPLALERLGGAFDRVTRTVDVRSISQGPGRRSIGGRHNLPNVGLFLWRLQPMRLSNAPTVKVDARRYLFDALGAPRQLVNRPEAEEEIASVARPVNVPAAITRRMLAADPALWYGDGSPGPRRAFEITVDGQPVPLSRIEACDLSDDGAGWNHVPTPAPPDAGVRVDPELGRIAFPEAEAGEVRVTSHTAFPARIGGGEYDRAAGLSSTRDRPTIRLPDSGHPTIQSAVDALRDGGVVEIETNDVWAAPATIKVSSKAALELRAADGVRPILRASGPVAISGGNGARVRIDGFVVEGGPIEVVSEDADESLDELSLSHLTLIPGRAFTATGAPEQPGAMSLNVTAKGVDLVLEHAIAGPLRLHRTTRAEIRDSIVDAAADNSIDSPAGLAIAGTAGDGDAGGLLTIVASTVIGRIFAHTFSLVSNSILFARDPGDGSAPVRALRRQEGCMRFSFVPHGSVAPRRYRCQPQFAVDQAITARQAETGKDLSAAERRLIAERTVRGLVPSFTALSASHPAYCQLRRSAPDDIRTGASDEGEMGVYHHLFQPQRETNLRIRLAEYLRFSLEAGIFFET